MVEEISVDTIKVTKDDLTYELTPVSEGGYLVAVVEYPSCRSQGETIDEALENIEDALFGCLTVDQEEGLSIPETLEVWLAKVNKNEPTPHPQTSRTHPSA